MYAAFYEPSPSCTTASNEARSFVLAYFLHSRILLPWCAEPRRSSLRRFQRNFEGQSDTTPIPKATSWTYQMSTANDLDFFYSRVDFLVYRPPSASVCDCGLAGCDDDDCRHMRVRGAILALIVRSTAPCLTIVTRGFRITTFFLPSSRQRVATSLLVAASFVLCRRKKRSSQSLCYCVEQSRRHTVRSHTLMQLGWLWAC